jgi:hypothetical protein
MEIIATGIGLLVVIGIGLALLAIWIWTLLDIIRDQSKNSSEKLLWIVIVFFFPFLGTLLYLIMGRTRKTRY